ncbi:MAG: acetyl-coenzyme A synthetase N-terminal domain-containing protein, partial [Pseudomonadota bacterium]|nr:acetyl-coenzyme A synthetase N-terminal domain-containing protein [Pseudomonadota bacterium]
MPDPAVYPASDTMQQSALVSEAQYRAMYQQSISDPDAFWAAQAQRIVWKKPFTKVKNTSFDKDDLHIKWFEDGTLNVTESCLDRHAVLRGNDNAIIWEPEDEAQEARYITYSELSGEVNRLANGLLSLGIKRGDVVTIYMPMIP